MVDCCSAPGLTPLDDALEQLLAGITASDRIKNVSLKDACGLVLAKNVASDLNIPPADNSAMDGYALKIADAIEGLPLKQVAKVFAGHPYSGEIRTGECARIMTGGQVPAGCDAVVMQENVTVIESDQSETEAQIAVSQVPRAGENIRRAGEDIKVGQEILTTGRRLTPADIGLLASLGCNQVSVYETVTVAIMSTGDELKNPGEPLEEGQFYESNGYTVSALLEKFGVNLINFGIIPDDLDALRKAFTEADQVADVVITSGGVSVGEADYTKTVLEELGRVDFWKLAIKPGKPFAFGQLPNSYFIGLPGNPVSALVTLHQLGVPMLRKLSGEVSRPALRLPAIVTDTIKKSPGRTDFQRGVYSMTEDGQLMVSNTGAQGSGILRSMSLANCYIVLEQSRGRVQAGETVMIEPFDSLMS
jgi:molybdopterin molybdotransferase